ncbi:metallopeptidase TldD-related protein [Sulfolobus acidocaldarius]|uniref:Conserved Archaeal protein n=4 Tax=Sulfolobus acidocaldarius TaxID=2285 RepID=Q4JC25_SULAC|nr:metallopeptidase TldD-related protein [Sulfolobus acidocaldarius]AAY79654.1 conserved Archaeal protein [Sulfolobus acidocaldarius DSM 639]AGE70211.1 hypothetical protein SacN8_01150 [Sulfolobus acidocaldarius N8]AGE72486.1 hypothetical protein SacRon12I_01150 [Sulfolobus acidocaldarius Ron12/I]ALU29380.1 hypothetical protein ATY89_05095 [Sulfolobus acidocaldarius]ALU32109.1 hypothetical protein ATZ20_08120 [Sulfolobus acidocaldarius]
MIYEVEEEIINFTPQGNFTENRVVKVPRRGVTGGCSSFTHPSVKDFERIREINDDEATIVIKKVRRQIRDDEHVCVEEKVLNYVSIGDMKFGYVGSPLEVKISLDFLKSIRFNVLEERVWNLGRVYGILDPEASAHVFHNLVEFLKGDQPRIRLGEKILSDEISVYDNPLNNYLLGFSVFDDEGYPTKRKEIIADGTVSSYLGTSFTKKVEPGNARGFIPKPDYFNLEVSNGSWNVKEMIEDTKGDWILISGVKRSEIVKNSIRLFPRTVIFKGKGVVVREIAIPLQELLTIDAVSKDGRSVMVDENHGAYTPYVRLKVRPIIY